MRQNHPPCVPVNTMQRAFSGSTAVRAVIFRYSLRSLHRHSYFCYETRLRFCLDLVSFRISRVRFVYLTLTKYSSSGNYLGG